MKISKLKLIIPLILVMVVLVCQPAIWAGEHPWDGDSSPAGGHPGGSGTGGGNGSGDSTTPRPMTKLVSPQGGTGINIQIYIQGVFFRFATSVYSNLAVKDAKVPVTSERRTVNLTAVSGEEK